MENLNQPPARQQGQQLQGIKWTRLLWLLLTVQTTALIDEEVQQLISERYRYVQHLLSQHRLELGRIVEALLERESLNGRQLQSCSTT